MSDKRNENTDKKGTCVYEKDIHVRYRGQGAATNRKKGQGAFGQGPALLYCISRKTVDTEYKYYA
jgi:hypothetical protein